MRPDHRLALAALCTDLALYLLMLSLPYRVLELGASSFVLGLVPMLYAGPYSLVALTAGRLSDRWPRRAPIRFGLGLAITAAVILALFDDLAIILATVPLVGVGLGFFWPSVQAGFAELLEGRDLHRMTQRFNIAWSTGKGLGLLLGGLLLTRLGAEGLSLLAGAAWTCAALAIPWMSRPGDHSTAVDADPARPHLQRQRAFLRSAWIANGVAFGVAATLNHHLPKLLLVEGIGSEGFGVFLGMVFFAQTLLFALLGRRRSWHYRAIPLVAVQAMVALTVLAVALVPRSAVLFAAAPLLGIGLGFAYQSSLYYSLHAPVGRGRQAGVHEAALGVASAGIPVIGGAAVAGAGILAPFVVASIAVVTSLAVGGWWLLRTRRPLSSRAAG